MLEGYTYRNLDVKSNHIVDYKNYTVTAWRQEKESKSKQAVVHDLCGACNAFLII